MPIISQELFDRAQERTANFACHLSNDQLIEKLAAVLKIHGKLNAEINEDSPLCPTANTYYRRFGGLTLAYAKLGIQRPELLSALSTGQRIRTIRNELIASILKEFPNELGEVRRLRSQGLLRDRQSRALIAVRLAWCGTKERKGRYWFIDCHNDRKNVRDRITVVALLDENGTIEQLRIFPNMNFPGKSITLYEESVFLQSGNFTEEHFGFFEASPQMNRSRLAAYL